MGFGIDCSVEVGVDAVDVGVSVEVGDADWAAVNPPGLKFVTRYECQLNCQHALSLLTKIIRVVVGVKYNSMGVI
jgi:hypothetical protein